MRFQDSIDVAAPAERVFAVYADVERWPDWTGSTWVVTDLVPGRSFTWVAQGPGLRTTGIHEVAPREDGGCRVTATLDQKGLLGSVVGRLTKGLTISYLAMEVHGIKRHCER